MRGNLEFQKAERGGEGGSKTNHPSWVCKLGSTNTHRTDIISSTVLQFFPPPACTINLTTAGCRHRPPKANSIRHRARHSISEEPPIHHQTNNTTMHHHSSSIIAPAAAAAAAVAAHRNTMIELYLVRSTRLSGRLHSAVLRLLGWVWGFLWNSSSQPFLSLSLCHWRAFLSFSFCLLYSPLQLVIFLGTRPNRNSVVTAPP